MAQLHDSILNAHLVLAPLQKLEIRKHNDGEGFVDLQSINVAHLHVHLIERFGDGE